VAKTLSSVASSSKIIGFGILILAALCFHKRLHSNPTLRSMQPNTPWLKHIYVLYFVSLLTMIWSMIKVVVYVQGNDGYALSHEVFLYMFHGTLMLIVVGVFSVFHPSVLLPGTKVAHNRQVSLRSF
jgi:hypothetical protein